MKPIFLTFLTVAIVLGKRYERCELARELLTIHRAPFHQIPTWVCIAEHESQYMTHVIGNYSGDGSNDHGLFQINDRYWCSPPGEGIGCGLSCAELRDDDISNDFKCVQIIYKEHKKLQGDGFNAWAVYQPHCKGSKAEKYIKNCFDDSFQSLLQNEVNTDLSNNFLNTAGENGIFPFSPNATFDAFFTPKKSELLSGTDYLTSTKLSTKNINRGPKINLKNPFLFNSIQPNIPVSENTAIKFSNPSTRLLHYSKVTSTTPKFPYINRLVFFNPTTITPFSTVKTVTVSPKISEPKIELLPTINAAKPSTFSASQFRSLSIINEERRPSLYSVSQFNPVPIVSTVTTPSTFQTSSKFKFFPEVNTVRTTSKNSIINFRPAHSTSTLGPTPAFQTSKSKPFPSVNPIRLTSEKQKLNFRPAYSTSTFRPTSAFQSSRYKLFPSVSTNRITSEKPFSNIRILYSTSTSRPISLLQTSRSFYSPSPTVSPFFKSSATIPTKTTAHRPLFIFNGVKWY